MSSLKEKLTLKLTERKQLAIEQLRQKGETNQLPVSFVLLRAILLDPRTNIEQSIRLINEVANQVGLVPLDGQVPSWVYRLKKEQPIYLMQLKNLVLR